MGMGKIEKILATVAIVVTGVTAALRAETPDATQHTPGFTLKMPDGKPVSLEEAMGGERLVLVVLRGYPGYQCPYCQRQVNDFEENAAKFAAEHAHVLLVYPGPPAELDQKAKEFMASTNPLPKGFTLVVDPDYAFTNQYGLRWDAPKETAYPTTFVIAKNGVIGWRHISRSHGDRVTAKDALAELKELDAGAGAGGGE